METPLALKCKFFVNLISVSFRRFQKRLQNSVPVVHGIGVVGLQAAVPQGSRVPGQQSDAVFDHLQHPVVQL